LDTFKQFEDLGVSRLNVPLQVLGGGSVSDAINRLGDEIISKV